MIDTVFETSRDSRTRYIVGRDLEIGHYVYDLLKSKTTFVLADKRPLDLHLSRLSDVIDQPSSIVIPVTPGELAKNTSTVGYLLKTLIEMKAKKGDLIFAVGGGTVTDIAGAVAQALYRGVQLCLLPTTLIAQTDAAIGGKNGLNILGRKNQVGSFYHPSVVICDSGFLNTLSVRQLRSGLAEIIKVLAVSDSRSLRRLAHSWPEENPVPPSRAIDDAIRHSVLMKIKLLANDPFERNHRRLLNFGHTFAHAFEEYSCFGITHGEGVALGMLLELKLGEDVAVTKAGVLDELSRIIVRCLSEHARTVDPPRDWFQKVIEDTRRARHGDIAMATVTSIGHGLIIDEINDSKVSTAWQSVRETVIKEAIA